MIAIIVFFTGKLYGQYLARQVHNRFKSFLKKHSYYTCEFTRYNLNFFIFVGCKNFKSKREWVQMVILPQRIYQLIILEHKGVFALIMGNQCSTAALALE